MLTKEKPSDSHHSKSEYYEKYMQVLERAAELIQNRATLYLQETATP